MTRDRHAYIESGRKAGQASSASWRAEPCPAELVVGALDHPGQARLLGRTFTCQRPQRFQGGEPREHYAHRWEGDLGGKQVQLTWWEPP